MARDDKVALVIAEGLPVWQSVNAAAVLALSLGPRIPELLGEDVSDADGQVHLGIGTIPVPVLVAPASALPGIRARAKAECGLTVVDFNAPAQESRTYRGYRQRLGALPARDLTYVGLALHGPRLAVDTVTEGLALLSR
jgi:hypothetical protein